QERCIALASVLLFVQFILLFSNHSIRNSEKVDYWEASTIMKGLFNGLDPGGIIISYHAWFGFNYLQQIEGRRPDVTVLSLPSFLVPKLFTEFETSRFQEIVIPKTLTKDFGSAFLTQNVSDHPIYWEPVVEYNGLVARYLVPDGLVFKINPVPYELDDEAVQSYLSTLSSYLRFDQISDDSEELSFYAQLLSGHGTFFLERGVYEIALGHFKMASTMVPHQTQFLNMLGITYAYMEDYTQAEKNFLEAISIKPENYEPYLNLARMLMVNKQLDKAEHYFKKVLILFPKHLHALFSLGTINSEWGNKEKALGYFNKILELDESNEKVKEEIDKLLRKM
ncbi:MAG: tetratricopeptide repeat protein, partial [Waddliaceae bacterium]